MGEAYERWRGLLNLGGFLDDFCFSDPYWLLNFQEKTMGTQGYKISAQKLQTSSEFGVNLAGF